MQRCNAPATVQSRYGFNACDRHRTYITKRIYASQLGSKALCDVPDPIEYYIWAVTTYERRSARS